MKDKESILIESTQFKIKQKEFIIDRIPLNNKNRKIDDQWTISEEIQSLEDNQEKK